MFPRLIEQHVGLLHLTLVLCALISVFFAGAYVTYISLICSIFGCSLFFM